MIQARIKEKRHEEVFEEKQMDMVMEREAEVYGLLDNGIHASVPRKHT